MKPYSELTSDELEQLSIDLAARAWLVATPATLVFTPTEFTAPTPTK